MPIRDYVVVAKSNQQEQAQKLVTAIEQATGYTIPIENIKYDGGQPAIVFASSGWGNSAMYAGSGTEFEFSAAYDSGDVYVYKTGELISEAGLVDWFIEYLNLSTEETSMMKMKAKSVTEAELTVTEKTDPGFVIATDAIMAEIDKKSDELKAKILSTKTTLKPAAGCTAYYVSADGNDANNGKTPETAWKTLERASNVGAAGDVIYFRRGDLFRGNLVTKPGVSYSAYGEGDKPIICGSRFDGAKVGTWEETDVPNVYRYSERIADDVGLLVFNGGESYAIKVVAAFDIETKKPIHDHATKLPFTGIKDLPADLFFYHDLGTPDIKAVNENYGYIYLRSDEGNPAERFDSIEFNWRGNIIVIKGDNTTIDNLCVIYGGCHGVGSGSVNGLTVRNCEFAWIGGSLQYYKENGLPVRFGNAVEIYGLCKDYTVQNCYIHDVYDAGVTHQRSGSAPVPIIMEDILYDSNLFVNCIYSIEYFNSQDNSDENIMRNVTMSNNICRNAGGFGWQR